MRETSVRTVPDPDLEINKAGGGGGSHPDPEIRGTSLQKIFPALRASVWSKNKGVPEPPRPLP